MRIIRSIFLLLFVFIFIYGKAQPTLKIINNNTVSKNNSNDLKHLKVYIDNNKNESFVLKRKHKPRGIEVVNPILSFFSINQIYVYREIQIPTIESKYTSFLHCVDNKRGPPII